MKLTKKLTSLLLAMTLALSLAAVSVSAADDKDDKVIVPVDGSMLVDYEDVLPAYPHGDDFLCYWEDAVFDDSDDEEDPVSPQATTFTRLFSMTATSVEDLLCTGPTKEFTNNSLSKGYLKIIGTLRNNYSLDADMRVGGCWYDGSTSTFVSAGYCELTAHGDFSVTIARSKFPSGQSYRGFIKNLAQVGEISGSCGFYNADG